MKEFKIKLGVASTRRSIFSKDDAINYKDLTCKKLKELGIEFVDINEEGLLFTENHLEKFKDEKVDSLFFPHCN